MQEPYQMSFEKFQSVAKIEMSESATKWKPVKVSFREHIIFDDKITTKGMIGLLESLYQEVKYSTAKLFVKIRNQED